jgi:hypothetical protein
MTKESKSSYRSDLYLNEPLQDELKTGLPLQISKESNCNNPNHILVNGIYPEIAIQNSVNHYQPIQ